jgi:hypothetical protein
MSQLEQLETRLSQDALARQEFCAEAIARLDRAGSRLPPDRVNAVRGLRVKTHLKAGPVDSFIWFDARG